jgi:intraflagellar transport protein 46
MDDIMGSDISHGEEEEEASALLMGTMTDADTFLSLDDDEEDDFPLGHGIGERMKKAQPLDESSDDDDTEEETSEEDEEDDDEEEEEEEEEEQESRRHVTSKGTYDPSVYDGLRVSQEVKELFMLIRDYKPVDLDLETRFKPFVPDFIPAVGDIDAYVKVGRPDGISEHVGLDVLDEPCAQQSDPSVLDLQLRAMARKTIRKEATVKKVIPGERSDKAIEQWIKDISDLHRSKPPPSVLYAKTMPDIDSLMQEWPVPVEEMLRETGILTADFECSDITSYVDLVCALCDIPVYKSRIQSLHVFFTLYSAFKQSQHFNQYTSGAKMV